jgi:hypothetical protein
VSEVRLFIFIFLLAPLVSIAQLIKGRVLDHETKLPLPYINIGVVNRNSGTVSMEDGTFTINLTEKKGTDTVRFSSIGYRPQTFLVEEMRNSPITEFHLLPQTTLLNEVCLDTIELTAKRISV